MIARCSDPSLSKWKDYGGRGIAVCPEWQDFRAFLRDMGIRPKNKTLDRFPNKDGNYEPSNCRWATSRQQRLNTRPFMYQRREKNTRGTYFLRKGLNKPWVAQIYNKGVRTVLGLFKTEEEAHQAYLKARG